MQRLSALVCLPPAVAMQAPVQHTMESLARRVEGLEAFVAMESNDTPNYYELRSEVTRIDNRIEQIDVRRELHGQFMRIDDRIDLVIDDAVIRDHAVSATMQRMGESVQGEVQGLMDMLQSLKDEIDGLNARLDSLVAGRAMSMIGKNADAMAVVAIQKMTEMHEEIAGLRHSLGVQEATIQRQAADIGRQSAEIGILRTRVGA